ncbi:hypothetical protein [Niallia taxi]|uniref:hypothetical protein n=1 Tax=Niallia taxi TaxID=2499688 RepID=UPI0011A12D16
MKRVHLLKGSLLLFTLLLFGCTNDPSKHSADNNSKIPESTIKNDETEINESNSTSDTSTPSEDENIGNTKKDKDIIQQNSTPDYDSQKPNNTSENRVANTLTKYSAQEIEYARIWLQLGPNQEIDELYITHINAGEPINPNDETSANYPEDVVHLSGSRLVDGSVTYSSNGDGTINIYKVPHRWDGKYPAGKQFYIDFFINDTELLYVDTDDDEKIIKLINIMNIQ